MENTPFNNLEKTPETFRMNGREYFVRADHPSDRMVAEAQRKTADAGKELAGCLDDEKKGRDNAELSKEQYRKTQELLKYSHFCESIEKVLEGYAEVKDDPRWKAVSDRLENEYPWLRYYISQQ